MVFLSIVFQAIYSSRIGSPRSIREWSSHGSNLCGHSPDWLGRDTQGNVKTLNEDRGPTFPPGNNQPPFFLSSCRPPIVLLLNHVFQSHPKDLILILPNCSNRSCGFVPSEISQNWLPICPPSLISILVEQAPASAFGRSQVTNQLRALWWLHTEVGTCL